VTLFVALLCHLSHCSQTHQIGFTNKLQCEHLALCSLGIKKLLLTKKHFHYRVFMVIPKLLAISWRGKEKVNFGYDLPEIDKDCELLGFKLCVRNIGIGSVKMPQKEICSKYVS